jgi:hypothetical protein
MLKIMSAKDVRRVLDAEIAKRKAKREVMKAEIEILFARRAAAKWLWAERWGRDGSAYA